MALAILKVTMELGQIEMKEGGQTILIVQIFGVGKEIDGITKQIMAMIM
jgi:hypothetical protein